MGPVGEWYRRIYGPQTQRSFNNFKIGDHRITIRQTKALRLCQKHVCLLTNAKCGAVTEEKQAHHQVVDEIVDGNGWWIPVTKYFKQTPINMNVNEVIAHQAKQLDESITLHNQRRCKPWPKYKWYIPNSNACCGTLDTKRVNSCIGRTYCILWKKIFFKEKKVKACKRLVVLTYRCYFHHGGSKKLAHFVDGLKLPNYAPSKRWLPCPTLLLAALPLVQV